MRPPCESVRLLDAFRAAGAGDGVAPSVFVLGAQKSGSTFVAQFLSSTLDFYYSTSTCTLEATTEHIGWQSEGHFFSNARLDGEHDDGTMMKSEVASESALYKSRLEHCSARQGSILFSKDLELIVTAYIAAPALACFVPAPLISKVKLIAILRHPIARSISQYNDRCLNKQSWDYSHKISKDKLSKNNVSLSALWLYYCVPGLGYDGPGTEHIAPDSPSPERFVAVARTELHAITALCPELLDSAVRFSCPSDVGARGEVALLYKAWARCMHG